MSFCSLLYGLFIASSFKDYGLHTLNDDLYLGLVVGTVANIGNGASRIIMGYLMDLVGFKKVYTFILLL